MIGRTLGKMRTLRSAINRQIVTSTKTVTLASSFGRREHLVRYFSTAEATKHASGEHNYVDNITVLQKEEDLQKFIDTKNKHIVVSFFAENCEGCKIVIPKFQKRASQVKKDFSVVKVDMEKFPKLTKKYAVEMRPHAFLYFNGKKIGEFKGKDVTDNQLDEFFKPLLQ